MAKKAGKKGKKPDNRPARARYWTNDTLRKRKVRNLMRSNKRLTEASALRLWESVRRGRMKGLGRRARVTEDSHAESS